MAKIIDALIVTLTFNTKGFSQGQKEVSEKLKKTRKDAAKTADEMEDSGKRAGEFFTTLKKGALGLASAYLTLKGFKDIIIGSKNSVVELAKASQLLDIPARKLDALLRTVREFNVSDEGFLGGLKAIQQGVTAFSITKGREGRDIIEVLRTAGINAFDINNKPRDAWSITQDFLRNIKRFNPREQADLLSRLGFSRDVTLLNNDPNKFSQRLNENYKNSAINEESIESLRRLNEKWIKAQNEFQTAGIKFTKTVAPILEFITDVISEIAIQLGKLFDNPVKYLSETPQGKFVEGEVKRTQSLMGIYDDNNKINNNTRGERNNNPLNLEYKGQQGAILESGSDARFAKFNDLSSGIKAGARQLLNYYHGQSAAAGYQKLQTVEDIISKWAPKDDGNDTESYIASVAKSLGVRRNTLLDLNNPDVLYRLIDAMSRVETGKSLSNNKKIAMQAIGEAVNSQSMITGRKSLDKSSMALGSRNEYAQNSSNNINNETNIGSITVNTQATDAQGIAKDIGVGIKKEQATFAFNGGLF